MLDIHTWAKPINWNGIVEILNKCGYTLWIANIIEIAIYDEHSMEDSGYMDMKLSKCNIKQSLALIQEYNISDYSFHCKYDCRSDCPVMNLGPFLFSVCIENILVTIADRLFGGMSWRNIVEEYLGGISWRIILGEYLGHHFWWSFWRNILEEYLGGISWLPFLIVFLEEWILVNGNYQQPSGPAPFPWNQHGLSSYITSERMTLEEKKLTFWGGYLIAYLWGEICYYRFFSCLVIVAGHGIF